MITKKLLASRSKFIGLMEGKYEDKHRGYKRILKMYLQE